MVCKAAIVKVVGIQRNIEIAVQAEDAAVLKRECRLRGTELATNGKGGETLGRGFPA